jgi:hypothetical protein
MQVLSSGMTCHQTVEAMVLDLEAVALGSEVRVLDLEAMVLGQALACHQYLCQ